MHLLHVAQKRKCTFIQEKSVSNILANGIEFLKAVKINLVNSLRNEILMFTSNYNNLSSGKNFRCTQKSAKGKGYNFIHFQRTIPNSKNKESLDLFS